VALARVGSLAPWATLQGRQARALTTLARTRVLLIDDWLMQKLTAEQRRDLMEVIDDRHGRASTIIATQLPVDRWHDMIGDPTYADAILDRLINNAYRLELKGTTMRPKFKPGAEDQPDIVTDETVAADG
jgi:DNA replication protein DnaC